MSEQRLHPASILFDIARYARLFVLPAVIAFVSGPRGGVPGMGRDDYDTSAFEVWLWVLVLPSVALSVVRYLTFRVRYEPEELVIRSGLVFRNVRHVPYARVQNLDAVQNVFHRALGVVDVRIETGGGSEPEARLSVVPAGELESMRARVFAGRSPGLASVSDGAGAPGEIAVRVQAESEPVRELLRLSLRDLLVLGLLENKGMVLVGAAYGALWESGLMNWIWSALFARTIDGRGLVREVGAFLVGRGPLPAGRLALALGGLALFLVLVRLVSVAWALLRLHDFRLTRVGDDLRVTYGFFTRVAATIPLDRVQTVTIRRGWLHRALGLASIRVETAGGPAGAAIRDREWVAPLVAEDRTLALLEEVLAGAAVPDRGWQPVHPRAFRRAVTRVLLAAMIPPAALGLAIGWPVAIAGIPLLIGLAFATRQHVRHLAWLASDAVVAFRSGWWSRAETFVRVSRVQSVTLLESPFDRRWRMSGVRVDTAGAGEWSHRVDIPYLDASVARELLQQVGTAAARTDFQW